jgi:hypothetical protein
MRQRDQRSGIGQLAAQSLLPACRSHTEGVG